MEEEIKSRETILTHMVKPSEAGKVLTIKAKLENGIIKIEVI